MYFMLYHCMRSCYYVYIYLFKCASICGALNIYLLGQKYASFKLLQKSQMVLPKWYQLSLQSILVDCACFSTLSPITFLKMVYQSERLYLNFKIFIPLINSKAECLFRDLMAICVFFIGLMLELSIIFFTCLFLINSVCAE